MATFLGADYCRSSTRFGGCAVLDARTRYEAEAQDRSIVNSEEDAQRFDIRIVLMGDEHLRRRFFAHRLEHGVTKRFTVAVPQDPMIVLPSNRPRLRSKGNARDATLAMYTGGGANSTLMTTSFFSLGGRIHTVIGAADYELPATGKVDVSIYPRLAADVPATTRIDFSAEVPVKHSGGDWSVGYGAKGAVFVSFLVRNDA